MLPLTTANAGAILVFNTVCSPNQNPNTTVMIIMIVRAVWKVGVFQILRGFVVKAGLPYPLWCLMLLLIEDFYF